MLAVSFLKVAVLGDCLPENMLSPHLYGLFKLFEKIGSFLLLRLFTYLLELPFDVNIDNIFYDTKLKSYYGDQKTISIFHLILLEINLMFLWRSWVVVWITQRGDCILSCLFV